MSRAGRGFYTALAALTLVMGLIPLWVNNPYYLNILNLVALNAIIVTGLNLLIGHAGQISLGHAGFVGLGAYISAVLSGSYGWPPLLSMPFAVVMAGLVALVIGGPTLRLKGNYLVMATLGFNLIITILATQLDWITYGPDGYSGIPPLSLAGWSLDNDLHFYYPVWALVILGLALARNLAVSRVGRGLRALHDSPVAAASMGVPIGAYKVKVFVLSAVYAAGAGTLYAHYLGLLTPDSFDIFYSVELVTICILGGMGSLWGGLVGAAFLTPLPQLLHFFEDYKDVFYGAILVLMLIFLPGGLVSLRLFKKPAPEPEP